MLLEPFFIPSGYPLSAPQLFGLGFLVCFIIGASFKIDLEFSWIRFFGALILTVFVGLQQGNNPV